MMINNLTAKKIIKKCSSSSCFLWVCDIERRRRTSKKYLTLDLEKQVKITGDDIKLIEQNYRPLGLKPVDSLAGP